jgi:hypothetical protein
MQVNPQAPLVHLNRQPATRRFAVGFDRAILTFVFAVDCVAAAFCLRRSQANLDGRL